MPSQTPELEVGPPAAAERVATLQLAWAHLAPQERAAQIIRLFEEARSAPEAFDGLLAARRQGAVVGGIWIQLQAGRCAFVSLPHVLPAEPVTTAAALLGAALTLLEQRAMRLIQALVLTDSGPEFDLLRGAGFEHFADLLYMASLERAFPDERPAADVDFEAYRDAHHDRLCRVIERTYVGSLDCPRLGGVRASADVVAGYRATGVFDPERWLFVRHAERDVGCLLLAEHPAPKQWEVAYVGLVPEARGRGWGLAAVRQAQWLARCARVERLLLAVDAGNLPAIATYAASGFTAWDRRTVMLRIFE